MQTDQSVDETKVIDETNFVRRSIRNPDNILLERRDIKDLVRKVRANHSDTVVLKIKDHIVADITETVMDDIIAALSSNKVCQALYIQNLSSAISDHQVKALLEVLQKKKIWCLNIGENYRVSKIMWIRFCKMLDKTNVTHLYVSEHVIDIELKNKMREMIRMNRKKHSLHCSIKNIKVIEKCTNMWWNPINAIKHQLDPDFNKKASSSNDKITSIKDNGKQTTKLTPHHTAYWAKGYGEETNTEWKFECKCGETCSSYENFRYHPIGAQYECTRCSIWSHVVCMLGNMNSEDMEELSELLCFKCTAINRRNKLKELKEANYSYNSETNGFFTI